MLKNNIITQYVSHQIKYRRLLTLAMSAILLAVALSFVNIMHARVAAESVVYSNDFETSASEWSGSGSITRVASGTNGIPAASGSFYGVVAGAPTGPNTQLGGYGSTWTNDWKTSIQVYLDPSWDADSGFIYAVAVNKPDGTHLRDFMLNAGVLNDASTGNVDQFVALADTAGSPTSDPLYHIKAMPAERRAIISSAGWYTVEHQFKNVDGRLVTTINLLNPSGDALKSWTIDYDYSNDLIPANVGGNRYGWFTHATVPGGIAIDNISRSTSDNKYNIKNDATDPVDITMEDNQTLTMLDVNDGEVTTPVDISLTNSSSKIQITIPAGTVISAQDKSWDGTINAPILESISSAKISGQAVAIDAAVKVGADTPLTFSKPVKVVIPNQAGKSAGYIDDTGVLHPISSVCATDPALTLVDGINECYLNSGNDLVIWTNHFSVFAAYTAPDSGVTALPGAPNTGLSSQNIVSLVAALIAGGAIILATIAPVRQRVYEIIQRKNK